MSSMLVLVGPTNHSEVECERRRWPDQALDRAAGQGQAQGVQGRRGAER